VTTFRMRIACWITKATNTHSEYVIIFHCNNTLHERASILRYTYIASLVGTIRVSASGNRGKITNIKKEQPINRPRIEPGVSGIQKPVPNVLANS
jgi:hypothetical protein